MFRWDTKKLNEVTDIVMGQSPASSDCNEDGVGLPFYQGNADFGYINPTPTRFCDKPKKVAEKGNILISVRAPVGDLNILQETAAIGRGVSGISVKSINRDFLFYYLQYMKPKWARLQQGSTFTAINKGDLANLDVPYPKHFEQQKIAAILSSVDEAIEKTEQIISQTGRVKQGLMQQLLTKGIGHTNFKETTVGEIPESWDVVELQNIAKVTGGKRLPKGVSLVDYDTGHPYIRVADLGEEGINMESIQFVPYEVATKITRYRIYKGELYISVAGTLGKVGEVPPELDGANLTENADRLSEISCDKDYLKYVLKSSIVQRYINREQTLNAQPKLALTRIKKFIIPLPPKDEQMKIAEIISSFELKLINETEKSNKLKNLKKGLMQQLLTGKVRVPGKAARVITS
ncbi:restriction endonuclease subunit S [Halobacillus trueperi]|uniref:Restriction endonuclease subunit S n=1 Tax=Halobacillus trueperi TaxID=156205 RepID=A0A3E0J4P2_9BACI|nr:restriction endonuclease subunit S [Halobacillus trueperi]REJ07747.1 restriction endonuclease subunit S [Halobacillus trueperi]